MKISYNKYPVDLIICIIISIAIIPITLFNINETIRIILGLPFILFIPGYILIFALFPTKKTDKGIDTIERIALSFGLSIAVVPLIGLGLNYTPFGIRLEPILISLLTFNLVIGSIAIYRWYKTPKSKRYTISVDLSFPKSENKLDKALTIILAIAIIIAIAALIYIIITPRIGEQFTEFYILGPTGNATDYPQNLSLEENANLIIGISNHEYKTINYTIEIWLINQTNTINETTNETNTIYNHMLFKKKIEIDLRHTPIDIEAPWTSQWEHNYSFNINRKGNYKLAFLLYTEPTENYSKNIDYNHLAEQKLEDAYRELHLWINIK